MIRKTSAGLTAIVASVSAIQAEAQVDATDEWGYGGYHNPWAVQQPSYGRYFGGISYGYGDSKVTKLQRDIRYLVKKNSALTASLTAVTDRLVAAEAAIADNDSDIAGLDTRVAENEGDITALDMMVSASTDSNDTE